MISPSSMIGNSSRDLLTCGSDRLPFYGSGEHDDVFIRGRFLVISQVSACLGLKQTNRDRSVCTHPEP